MSVFLRHDVHLHNFFYKDSFVVGFHWNHDRVLLLFLLQGTSEHLILQD